MERRTSQEKGKFQRVQVDQPMGKGFKRKRLWRLNFQRLTTLNSITLFNLMKSIAYLIFGTICTSQHTLSTTYHGKHAKPDMSEERKGKYD